MTRIHPRGTDREQSVQFSPQGYILEDPPLAANSHSASVGSLHSKGMPLPNHVQNAIAPANVTPPTGRSIRNGLAMAPTHSPPNSFRKMYNELTRPQLCQLCPFVAPAVSTMFVSFVSRFTASRWRARLCRNHRHRQLLSCKM